MAPTSTATARGPRRAAEGDGEIRAELTEVDQKVRAFVKERPVLALLGAIAAGYLIGRVLGRRG